MKPVCPIQDCGRTAVARGFCHKHWKRWRAHGDPTFVYKRPRHDISGQRFGRLTALRYDHMNAKRRSMWLCLCDCGTQGFWCADVLKNGNTKSCGCLKSDVLRARGKITIKRAQAACITHGLSKTPLERLLHRMVQRCENPNNPDFHHYGGRGITVCSEWRHDPQAFASWALANGYRKGLSIERKNNDAGYEPGNCRFATQHEQMANTRRSRWIEWRGERKLVSHWERDLGIGKGQLSRRILSGESPADALEKLVGSR